MTLDPVAWLRQTKAVYLDNATSRRDYRVQLRGNRSVMLFGVYLFILIGVGMIVYSNSATVGEIEVVEAQRKLQEFYGVIMGLLGGLVTLIAPALTATTVVAERQRRSFDLIFSAPVTPKYFLVGKMMSSYRYTWMLLVLSLPVTAACVVLGGASWGDVLTAYLLLSLHGLMLTAIGLLMSTVSPRPVTAVLWSYLASIGYLLVTMMAAEAAVARTFMGGGGSREAPFFSSLNPFLVRYTSDTYTTIGAYQVPNWVFTILIAALVSKICLLGAGALLSPRPEREIRSLRIHMIVYFGGLLLYLGWASSGFGIGSISTSNMGKFFFWALTPLFLFIPFLSTFGVDSERRFWPDGIFSLRHILDGRPSGGLSFLILFILTSAGSLVAGLWFGLHTLPSVAFAYWLVYAIGYWTFFWSIGRYASSMFVGLRSSRALQFASYIFFVMLPIPLLSNISEVAVWDKSRSAWDLYLLRPLFIDPPQSENHAFFWGLVLLLVGTVIAVLAEVKTRRKMALLGERYEASLQPA